MQSSPQGLHRLYNLFQKDSPILEKIVEERNKLRRGRGNAGASHTPVEEVDKNCLVFTELMRMGTGTPSKHSKVMFWLPTGSDELPPDVPPPMAVNDYFGGAAKHPVFLIRFDAVKTRLTKQPERNTKANKAIRWEDIDDAIIRTKRKITTKTKGSSSGSRAIEKVVDGVKYRLATFR